MFGEKDIKRFWSKVKKGKNENDCWIWQGFLNKQGYGAFRYKGKYIKAHRFSWMIEHGEIPEGMCVCHHCDNPSCCNHKHLFLGTNKDNCDDRDKKGRNKDWTGRKHTLETKKKMRLSAMGHKRTLGKKHTEEGRKNMSIARKSYWNRKKLEKSQNPEP